MLQKHQNQHQNHEYLSEFFGRVGIQFEDLILSCKYRKCSISADKGCPDSLAVPDSNHLVRGQWFVYNSDCNERYLRGSKCKKSDFIPIFTEYGQCYTFNQPRDLSTLKETLKGVGHFVFHGRYFDPF